MLVLLILSAFFSASETALLGLSKIKMKNLEAKGSQEAVRVSKLLTKPKKLLSSILVGNNLVNIAASALATSVAIHYFGGAGIGIATATMTIVILVFGEITPKSFAIKSAEKIAIKVTPIMFVIVWVFNPVTKVLLGFTHLLMKIMGSEPNEEEPFITEEELKTMISIGHEEGVLEKEEKMMLHKVFVFGDLLVRDVMVPRIEVDMISLSDDYNFVRNVYKKNRYSRIPVFENSHDNVVGVLFMKDLFSYVDNGEFEIGKRMREPFYVYENELIAKVFFEMKKKRAHLAVVIDEYGGMAGIITLEDMLEEIVGEIYDEYDEVEKIKTIDKDEYIVKGSIRIRELNELIDVDIEQGDFDTLAGFIIDYLGRLPKSHEKFKYKDLNIVIDHADKKRILTVRIKKSQVKEEN